jgi:hypothetical protein
MSGDASNTPAVSGIGPAVAMRELLEQSYIAPSPSLALEKIRRRFACELTVRGDDCAGIMALRRLIASIDSERRYAKCLLITAPHTHWGEEKIVESFDAQRRTYLIGARPGALELTPYSFVFSGKSAIPYEWADESVPIEQEEFALAWNFIDRLNRRVAAEFPDLPIPLGVTIDHRFKKSIFDAQVFSFAETPAADTQGLSVVRALIESVVEDNPVYPGRVQAAWFAAPDEPVETMDATEVAALARLEKTLAEQPPEQALKFLEDLEAYLRSK